MTLDDLSPRKREIALLIGAGLSYPKIASRLQSLRSYRGGTIRPRTVQMHATSIAARLGADEQTVYQRVRGWVLGQRGNVPRPT